MVGFNGNRRQWRIRDEKSKSNGNEEIIVFLMAYKGSV
jgi:hypothetical protein